MQTKGPCLEEILCSQTSQCFDSVPEKVGLLSFLYMCSFFCFNFHYQSKAFLVSLHFLFHCFVITKLICMLSHNHIALFCITCFLLIACNPSSPSSFPFSHYLCMLQQFWLRQYTTQSKDRAPHPPNLALYLYLTLCLVVYSGALFILLQKYRDVRVQWRLWLATNKTQQCSCNVIPITDAYEHGNSIS